MKLIKLCVVIFFTLSSMLPAQEDNNTVKNLDVITVRTLEIQKSTESSYDEFVNLFSDYDGTWAEDMFIYSVDIFMPDEMMRTVKDVIKNRKDEGYDSQEEVLPKTLGNDAYNMFLTMMYYYMQDVSQITERVWSCFTCE